MNDERISTTDGLSRRRLIRLSGGIVASAGMASLAGCGFPRGEEDDEENGGAGGGDEEGAEEDD